MPQKKKTPVKSEYKKTFRLKHDELEKLKEIMQVEDCTTENGAIKTIISKYLILKYDLQKANSNIYNLGNQLEELQEKKYNFFNAFDELRNYTPEK